MTIVIVLLVLTSTPALFLPACNEILVMMISKILWSSPVFCFSYTGKFYQAMSGRTRTWWSIAGPLYVQGVQSTRTTNGE